MKKYEFGILKDNWVNTLTCGTSIDVTGIMINNCSNFVVQTYVLIHDVKFIKL